MPAPDNAWLGARWLSVPGAVHEPEPTTALHTAQPGYWDQARSMVATPDAKDDRPANVELAGRIESLQDAARRFLAP